MSNRDETYGSQLNFTAFGLRNRSSEETDLFTIVVVFRHIERRILGSSGEGLCVGEVVRYQLCSFEMEDS